MIGDSSYYESKEEEYNWYESMKRELDVIHRWKEQFFGGNDNEDDQRNVQR